MLGGGLFTAALALGALLHARVVVARPALVLAQGAIVSRTLPGAIEVPWDAVTAVANHSVAGRRFVAMTTTAAPAAARCCAGRTASASGLAGCGFRSTRAAVDPAALVAAIGRLRDDPAARADIASGELAAALAGDANLKPASLR